MLKLKSEQRVVHVYDIHLDSSDVFYYCIIIYSSYT